MNVMKFDMEYSDSKSVRGLLIWIGNRFWIPIRNSGFTIFKSELTALILSSQHFISILEKYHGERGHCSKAYDPMNKPKGDNFY